MSAPLPPLPPLPPGTIDPSAGLPGDPCTLGVRATRDAIASRRVSAIDVTNACLARIDALNPRLNAFLQVFHDEARAQARALDERLSRQEPVGPLAGVPIAIKDNIALAWGRTTCASRMLEHYRSPYTATAAQRLIDAGAIIVGKTNLDEFAMGSTTEHSAFGPTRNPWDTDRVPGGTSGGSAAAVAAGMCASALGSDTGGSIRQPAGWCGIVGLKPTYGVVSRYGLVAHASSLDQIGPLARSVEDAAMVLAVIAGQDAHDATSLANGALVAQASRLCSGAAAGDASPQPSARALRIGVLRESLADTNAPSVREAVTRATAALIASGATVETIDLPSIDRAIAAYYIIATAEASSNLARFDGVRFGRRATLSPGEGLESLYARSRSEGLGPEVQRRIMLGTHVLRAGYADAYYQTALRARRVIRDEYARLFEAGFIALLMPTSPGPALRLGEVASDPLAMYLQDVYTVGVNLAGLPAIAVRAGFDTAGPHPLPVGVQLVGPALSERAIIEAARVIEASV